MKRALFVFIATVFACSACYGFAGGDGSAVDPYQVSTKADLQAISPNLVAHYILTNDIDLNNEVFNQRIISYGFKGTLDGRGYKILNFSVINTIGGSLFSNVEGTIRNLSIINATLNAPNSTVGTITGTLQATGVIENCYVSSVITATKTHLGGLVAINYGTIVGCAVDAVIHENDLNSIYSNAGLMVGHNYGGISDSYAKGRIVGETFIGGFAGYNTASGIISRCYCSVEFTANAGGALGFAGWQQNGTVDSCFWDIDAAAPVTLGANPDAGTTALDSVQMQEQTHYLAAGWDFSPAGLWFMPASGTPLLKWQAEGTYCISPPFFDYNGDCLVNLVDLAAFADQWLNCGYANQSLCPY